MLIEQRPARWWNALNRASRSAILNIGVPGTVHPLVNEYPKSGGSWLAQMLGSALAIPNPRRRLPMLRSSMMHGHYLHPGLMRNMVMVWRDGRDVMVSFYYHLVADNTFASPAAKAHSRRLLNPRDPDDIVTNLPRFIELVSEGRLHPGFGWGQFFRRWHGHPRVAATTRYEAMLADAAGELHRLQHALGGRRSHAECAEIAARFSFEAQARRKAGETDNTSFLRKGVAGDWRNHFSPEAAQIFDHHAGDALVALGYEPDRRWAADFRAAPARAQDTTHA